MKPDRIAELFAVGLALAACSPEEPPRDAAPGTPGAPMAATEDPVAGTDVPAAKDASSGQSGAEPETRVNPDPQARVDLPVPPVRVPENPPPH